MYQHFNNFKGMEMEKIVSSFDSSHNISSIIQAINKLSSDVKWAFELFLGFDSSPQ